MHARSSFINQMPCSTCFVSHCPSMLVPRGSRRWADIADDEDMTEIHRGLLGPGAVQQPHGGGAPTARPAVIVPVLPETTLELETAAWVLTWMEPDIWPDRRSILLAWAPHLLHARWARLWTAVVLGLFGAPAPGSAALAGCSCPCRS